MPPSYSCNVLGTCTGQTAQQTALFVQLQRELNRVRAANGLPADVTVDGKIGASTTAKLIKLVDKLVGSGAFATRSADGTLNVATKLDPVLRMDLSSRVVAANALNVVQALQRNGYSAIYWNVYDPTHNPNPGADMTPVTINPYAGTVNVNPSAPLSPLVGKGAGLTPATTVAVGPTAGGGGGAVLPGFDTGGYASPGFSSGMPLWMKIGLGVLGVGAVAAVGAAVVTAVRR